MPLFDILGLIPPGLQRQIVDSLVDLVSEQAEKFLGDQVAGNLKKLKSDAAFAQAFQDGLQRAADRFAQEYETQDEDLIAAIAADKDFFKNEQVSIQGVHLWSFSSAPIHDIFGSRRSTIHRPTRCRLRSMRIKPRQWIIKKHWMCTLACAAGTTEPDLTGFGYLSGLPASVQRQPR